MAAAPPQSPPSARPESARGLGRLFYTLPRRLLNAVTRGPDPALQLDPAQRRREFERSGGAGDDRFVVGFRGNSEVWYPHLRTPRRLRKAIPGAPPGVAQLLGQPAATARAKLDLMQANYAWVANSSRAYCGWLLTNREFVDEHDAMFREWNVELDWFGIPNAVPGSTAVRPMLPGATVTSDAPAPPAAPPPLATPIPAPDSAPPPVDVAQDVMASLTAMQRAAVAGWASDEHAAREAAKRRPELNKAFAGLYARWRLEGLSGPYLPRPFRPWLGGSGARLISPEMEAAGRLVYLPDTFVLFGEAELRAMLAEFARPRARDAHLKGWAKIASASNPAKNRVGRLPRVFELQHFWRVLHHRHAAALKGQTERLRNAFARFYRVGDDTIRNDLRVIRTNLGADWFTRPSALDVF